MNFTLDKIPFLKLQYILIICLFLSQFLFLISFGNVQSLPITIPFIILVAFIIVSLIGAITNQLRFSLKRLIISLIILLTFVFSAFFSKSEINIKSLVLYVFYFISFGLVDNRTIIPCGKKVLKIFTYVITFLSLYSIYQFIAYNYIPSLPLKELIPEFLWTSSYNTTQYTHTIIFGKQFYKAHSIYAEASGLSRYSAIGLLLLINFRKDFKGKCIILFSIINILSLFVSLSGSGFIILIFGLLYYLFTSSLKGKAVIVFLIILCILIVRVFDDSEFLNYYMGRTSEFSTENASGYYRFILPFKIGLDNMKTGIFGFGLGNDEIAIAEYGGTELGIANGYGKIFVELGILGLIEFLILILNLKPNKNSKLYKDSMLLFVIMIAMILVTNVLNPSIWGFILLIECFNQDKIICENDKSVFEYSIEETI